MELFADASSVDTLKVCVTAGFAGVNIRSGALSTVSSKVPQGTKLALITADGAVLTCANAICRYIALKTGHLTPEDLAVDELVEAEASVFTAAGLAAGVPAVVAALEAKAPTKFLLGDAATLADTVFGVALHAAFAANTLPAAALPNLAAYAQRLSTQKGFKTGVKVHVGGPSIVAVGSGAAPTKYEAVSGDLLTASLMSLLVTAFNTAFHTLYPQLASTDFRGADIQSNPLPRLKHHYQCNSSMLVASLTKAGNPRVVATAVAGAVGPLPFVRELEVSGPGFINIHLHPEFVAQRINSMVATGVVPPPAPKRRVVVDYSSPNIAKEMHVGHLRSTIIGDAIARIIEFAGHEVLRVNHIGDWGTQFGMLIAHLKDTFPDAATNPPSIADLNIFYKAAKGRFDKEPEFKLRSQQEVVKLQAGDEINLQLWRVICKKSEEMFSEVYSRLGVDSRLEVVGESFYNSRCRPVVDELRGKGLLSDDGGAVVMRVPGFEIPLMVVKSDGGVGYDSTDLAALKYRLQELKADWLVYVVDAGQSLHFDLVFRGGQMAGWYDNTTARVEHVAFGVVQGEDKKKFKSRSGDTVRLVDLLDEARDQALASLKERQSTEDVKVDDAQLMRTAEALGYGGVKYFDLRQNRLSDYVFSYERMLSADGDTAVYLQYANARISSLLRKAAVDVAEIKNATLDLEHPSEIALAVELLRFSEALESVLVDLYPHRLCEYLYKLCGKYTDFYRDCRVVGDARQMSRLKLAYATSMVVGKCMVLLGINPLERL